MIYSTNATSSSIRNHFNSTLFTCLSGSVGSAELNKLTISLVASMSPSYLIQQYRALADPSPASAKMQLSSVYTYTHTQDLK